jgi:hypothetical protein
LRMSAIKGAAAFSAVALTRRYHSAVSFNRVLMIELRSQLNETAEQQWILGLHRARPRCQSG